MLIGVYTHQFGETLQLCQHPVWAVEIATKFEPLHQTKWVLIGVKAQTCSQLTIFGLFVLFRRTVNPFCGQRYSDSTGRPYKITVTSVYPDRLSLCLPRYNAHGGLELTVNVHAAWKLEYLK